MAGDDTEEHPISVAVKSASKHFGRFVALSDVSISVRDGEIVSLLGPSGCGKTTLMRLIAGFEELTSGAVEIDGVDMAGSPPEERPVNMVFQRYALFPHLDVFNNVAFGLKMKGVAKSEIGTRVRELLSIVQLEEFSDRRISELSGGQSQRVALARALVNRPKVLLLDEPLAALDLKIRQQMLIEMKRIHAETKATFIYVTHDQDEAMILSDRIVLMERGRIMQIDEPRQMYARPKTLFAAKFLGEANILRGKIHESSGDTTVVEISNGDKIVSSVPNDLEAGQSAVVSLRPEAIRFGSSNDGDGETLSGKVEDVTFIGARSFYQVAVATGQVLSVQVQDAIGGNLPVVGDSVHLRWDPDHVVVLARS